MFNIFEIECLRRIEDSNDGTLSEILTALKDAGWVEDCNVISDVISQLKVDNANDDGNKTTERDDVVERPFADMRFLYVTFSTFRHFKISDRPYGLNLKRNKKPISLYVVGRNGAGKSSIYGVLEHRCFNGSGEGSLRGFGKNDSAFKTNVLSGSKEFDIKISTLSGRDVFDRYPLNAFFCSENDLLSMLRKAPKNLDGDWSDFFSSVIGYDSILNLFDRLEGLKIKNRDGGIKKQREAIKKKVEEIKAKVNRTTSLHEFKGGDYNKYADEINNCIKGLNQLKASLDQKRGKKVNKTTAKEQNQATEITNALREAVKIANKYKDINAEWSPKLNNWLQDLLLINTTNPDNLQQLIEDKKGDTNLTIDNLIKGLQSIINDINDVVTGDSGLKDIFNDIDSLYERSSNNQMTETEITGLDEMVDKFINRAKGEINRVVRPLINEDFKKSITKFFEGDKDRGDCNAFMSLDESIKTENKDDKILIEVSTTSIDKSKKHKSAPCALYFNTFRLKLFLLYLRMLTAMRIMTEYNFIFPLVYDDVFYSSDFENKHTLRSFFANLHEAVPDAQVIFFTHDEQILTVCHEALKDLELVAFGRVIDYSDPMITDMDFNLVKPRRFGSEGAFRNLYISF